MAGSESPRHQAAASASRAGSPHWWWEWQRQLLRKSRSLPRDGRGPGLPSLSKGTLHSPLSFLRHFMWWPSALCPLLLSSLVPSGHLRQTAGPWDTVLSPSAAHPTPHESPSPSLPPTRWTPRCSSLSSSHALSSVQQQRLCSPFRHLSLFTLSSHLFISLAALNSTNRLFFSSCKQLSSEQPSQPVC